MSTNYSAKADCVNTLHAHINKIAPKVNEYLANATIKVKVDGTLFEANAKAIREIIQAEIPDRVNIFFHRTSGNVYVLECKSNYPIEDYGCIYINRCVRLKDFEPLPTNLTPAAYAIAVREFENLDEQVRALKFKMSSLKHEFDM